MQRNASKEQSLGESVSLIVREGVNAPSSESCHHHVAVEWVATAKRHRRIIAIQMPCMYGYALGYTVCLPILDGLALRSPNNHRTDDIAH